MESILKKTLIALCSITMIYGCKNAPSEHKEKAEEPIVFAESMVKFSPIPSNPVFQGTGTDTWDRQIRERGYILNDEGSYKMWYTGYNDNISETKYLGYATSKDGINWERYSDKPIYSDRWTEDMQVIKYGNLYYMVAEGLNDIAHLLTSKDGAQWDEQGDLIILKTNGEPISPGPYGTPTLWVEEGKKYLFYERNDQGIWLATSDDFKTWTNVQDDPVIAMGPDPYDAYAVAANQVVKFQDKYYLYYHGCADSTWMEPDVISLWNSNVAVSEDLIHWEKYSGNPIVEGDHSSPILVDDGEGKFRLYAMHDKVWCYEPL
ncbi:MAG: glycosylase [Cyclobacteriaceae bacterium]